MTGWRRSLLRSVASAAAAGLLLAGTGCAPGERDLPLPTASQPCPAWVYFPANRHSNRDPTYLGCSTTLNLQNTVARPRDLAEGRPLGPADGTRAAAAVNAYEQDKVKPFASSGAMTPTFVMMGGGATSGP